MLKKSIFGLVAAAFISSLVMSLPGCGGGGGGGTAAAAAPGTPGATAVNFYVNSATGNNASAVLGLAPYKTIASAVQYASTVAATNGANINVASGVYNVASGEVFPIKLTNGENLIGSGTVDIEGSGNYTVLGGGKTGVAFATTIVVSSGVTASITGVAASGVAPTFLVADNAKLTMSNSNLPFPLTAWVVRAYNGSQFTATNNTLNGFIGIDAEDSTTKVTARGNTFKGTYGVVTANGVAITSQLDLGTAANPGNNTILSGTVGVYSLNNYALAEPVSAVGNTWHPGIQLADPQGHYPAQHIAGPTTVGTNYGVASTAGITF